VLFHGRGADERDLLPLLDLLDPERRFLGVTPRGPLHLPPGGAHWYAVREIGYPEAQTFTETYAVAASWLDDVVDDAGLRGRRRARGFSQGAVMACARARSGQRDPPAMALSGFVPAVPGFELGVAQPPAR
jgi:predicted esterase